jgi:hypothetical protein
MQHKWALSIIIASPLIIIAGELEVGRGSR